MDPLKTATIWQPDELPEEVLSQLAAGYEGATLAVEKKDDGHVLLHIRHGAYKLLTVVEPPGLGWPVRVFHWHAAANGGLLQGTHTEHYLCGPGHDPHRHRIAHGDHVRLTPAEVAEREQQQEHTPIHTPQKLFEVCRRSLESDVTKHVLAHAKRAARRGLNPDVLRK